MLQYIREQVVSQLYESSSVRQSWQVDEHDITVFVLDGGEVAAEATPEGGERKGEGSIGR